MNIVDTYTLLYTVIENADRVFEFWMSASFAVIIATFVGSNHLDFKIRSAISFLYLIFATTSTNRLVVASSKIEELRESLIQQGETFSSLSTTTVEITFPLLIVSGIAATMYSIWREDKQ